MKGTSIRKLLIANRGEIARRIARTARRLGIAVATVHSSADRDALHVRDIGESIAIGGAAASQSYLNADAIINAALRVGADAIHPGIGFLSEDPNFAESIEARGLTFVGPRPETMRRFADKWSAKHEACQAGVPVIGGSEGSSSDAAGIARLIEQDLQLPIVLKAAAGGGGRGVRIVRTLENLQGVIESAMREAQSSFGRPELIVEQFVENARHLEVQIAGDGQGSAIHLFERECSLQRRFQKVIEEAPAANLSAQLRQRLLTNAVGLAKRVSYRNVGTMEFLVLGDRHYFLECNPRLQVEHTVTEEVTGVDLVELQLNIAMRGELPFGQTAVTISGHAIQARVCAENPSQGFIPSTGRLELVEFPSRLRVETGVETGSVITPHYDSMIAKLIASGPDRGAALDRLGAGLDATVAFGVDTNLEFLRRLLNEPIVRTGVPDNRYIDRELSNVVPSSQVDPEWLAVATALLLERWNADRAAENLGMWTGSGDLLVWRYTLGEGSETPATPIFSLCAGGDESVPIYLGSRTAAGLELTIAGKRFVTTLHCLAGNRYQVDVGSQSMVVSVSIDPEMVHLKDTNGRDVRLKIIPFLSLESASAAQGGQIRAPMMGMLTKVKVKLGDIVRKGDILIVQESMKMELNLESPSDGAVTSVGCAEGSMVERHQVLMVITPN